MFASAAKKGTTMRAVIVVESMFGNTRQVASAIAEGLATATEVSLAAPWEAPETAHLLDEADLVVVGGPTHAFGMSRKGTRRVAIHQGASDNGELVGIREWLAAAHPPRRGTAAAAFDTRLQKHGGPGSAAHAALRALRHRGFRVLAPPNSFWVEATPGPLKKGERTRAYAWGTFLAGELQRSSTTASR